MKIAILTSGILPVPAVQGGAVENLVDFYLEYNDQHRLHDITVYSIWHPNVVKHPAMKSEVNHYRYIKVDTVIAKIRKQIQHRLYKNEEYYHYTVEYYLRQSLRHIRKRDYDIILIENRPGFALKLKGFFTGSIVYHLHNAKLDSTVCRAQEIYDLADKIFTVSDYIGSVVKTINPDDTKCVTIHNGIDLRAFCQDAVSLRDRFFQTDDFVMVFSGRITREKGISELIGAMLALKTQRKIKLLVIGSSFYGNANSEGNFIRSLKAMAEGIKEQIVFTGFIPYAEMPNYLRMADVAVIPSVWDDPFPTTVLEAQAMGLPIITTRRGGIPEEVTAENAILLNTDEHFVDNLAAAILDLYEHPEKRQLMASASRQRAHLFDKETYARNFFQALAG